MIFPTSENRMIEKICNSFNYQFLQRNKFLSFFSVAKILQISYIYYILFVDAKCFNFQKNIQCVVGSISGFQRVVSQSGSIFNCILKISQMKQVVVWHHFLANINRQKKILRIKLLRPNIFALFVLFIFSKFI